MDKFLGFKTDEILTCLLLIVVGYVIAKMFNGCSNNGFSVGIQRRSDGNNCVDGETCNAGGDTQYRYPCPSGGQCYNLVIDDGTVKNCINPEGVVGSSLDTYCIQGGLPDPNIPVDCEGHWDVNNCDEKCERKYVVDTPALNGGKQCDDIDKTKNDCQPNQGKCPSVKPNPVECEGLLKLQCLISDKCLHINRGQGKEICIEKNKDCSAISEKKTCNDSKECIFKKGKCMSDCGIYSKIGLFDLAGNQNNKYNCPIDCYDSSLGADDVLPGKISINSCTFFCDNLNESECNNDPKCKIENNTCTELKCNDGDLDTEKKCRDILGCTYDRADPNKSCKNSCNDSTVFKKEQMCKEWSDWQTQRERNYKPIIYNIESSRKTNKNRYINYNLCEWDDKDGQCNIKSKI